MNIERGFRRMTVVLSVGVVGLLAWLILWPALTSVMDALSWVERPYRFILPTDAGRYLVGATYPITEELNCFLHHSVSYASRWVWKIHGHS
jgi:hypothetical protein